MIVTAYFLCVGVAVVGNFVVGCELAFHARRKSFAYDLNNQHDVLVLTVARVTGYLACLLLPIKVICHGIKTRWLAILRQFGFIGLPGLCIALSTWAIYLVKNRKHFPESVTKESESEGDGLFLIVWLALVIIFSLVLLIVRSCWIYKSMCGGTSSENKDDVVSFSGWSANSRGITLTFVGHFLVNFTLQLEMYGGAKALFTKYLGASVLLVYFITFFFLFGRKHLSRNSRFLLILLPVISSILSIVGISLSVITAGVNDRVSLVVLFVSDILLNILLYAFVHERIFPTKSGAGTGGIDNDIEKNAKKASIKIQVQDENEEEPRKIEQDTRL